MATYSFEIRLFGRVQVTVGDRCMPGFETGKAAELFVYLLIHRDNTHFRETLAETLWGECTANQCRKYLRQTLWQLQTTLGNAEHHTSPNVVTSDAEWIGVQLQDVWLDVADFEMAHAVTRGVTGRQLDQDRLRSLQMAVDLYRGDLLEGYYQDWVLFNRERFRLCYLSMLQKLMEHCESTQMYEQGLDYGRRILCLERAHERTHRRMMRLYYLAGDRTCALRQYHECRAVLHEELGVEPALETDRLYKQLASDTLSELEPTSIPLPDSESARPSVSTLPSWNIILQDIDRMERRLAMMRDHIRKCMAD